MILAILIFWFMAGGLLAWLAGRWGKNLPRWISLITLIISMIGLIVLWVQYLNAGGAAGQPLLAQLDVPWIPQWGINFTLAMDGVSLMLVILTNFLGIMGVLASWNGIQHRIGFFHFNLLWILAAIAGIFVAMDLFLFYFFWEMMLVPLYFLIGIWGHENRTYATLKFFIFTQASSLFMLLSILGVYAIHGQATGEYTFNLFKLIGTPMSPTVAFWLMLGFFIAFAVKLPLVPFHTWLPDAHTEAPTAGSVDLAGLVLKVGAYGFLRFLIPLFPAVAFQFAPVVMILGVIGILYGAIVAYGQTDMKRLVAYTSVSHMGFVALGIFAWNPLALQGALMVMLAHGVTTGALFILVGDLDNRTHTRDMQRMAGLWPVVPKLAGFSLFFSIATLGLPGLGNFVGEILVLLGVYRVSVPIAVFATLGFIVSTIYSLWMMQRVFFGKNEFRWDLPKYTPREITIQALLAVAIIWLGLYPQPILNTARRGFDALLQRAPRTMQQTTPPAAIAPTDAQETGAVQTAPHADVQQTN
jgi:NADH-quinone oxidoreductase subunit M